MPIFVKPPAPVINPSIRIPFATSAVKIAEPVLIPPVIISNESEVDVPVEKILPPALPMDMRPVQVFLFFVFFKAP
ncbi:unannotated protein [freshwater metagenome]|uniref:Unannotated protein n=1 Tax=freshwater metagenome TaxID=449393 RepID=A0A6J6ZU18_9ZZZZ